MSHALGWSETHATINKVKNGVDVVKKRSCKIPKGIASCRVCIVVKPRENALARPIFQKLRWENNNQFFGPIFKPKK